MMGDVFLTVPRCFSSLFASAHVIGQRLGINQSAIALDGVSAVPGKHMLHMCRKSLVINFFFSQISGFYPFELRWVSKMFVHYIKPSSSVMYNLWKWSDGRGKKILHRSPGTTWPPCSNFGRPVRYWQICDVFTRNINWTRCTKI